MKTLRFFAATGSMLILAACSHGSSMDPKEVLMHASKEGRNLQSASFGAQATFDTSFSDHSILRGTATMNGRMQQGGSQLDITFQASGNTEQKAPATSSSWKTNGELIVGGENEVYINVQDVAFNPPNPILSSPLLSQLLGKWWKLPSNGTDAAVRVAPDPRILRMQSEVMDVVKDRGMSTVHGRQTYHYDVKINPEKLKQFLQQVSAEKKDKNPEKSWQTLVDSMDATGELWIDAETFFVQGLRWNISPKDAKQPMHVQFTLDLSDFNKSQPIQMPPTAHAFPSNPLDALPSNAFPVQPMNMNQIQNGQLPFTVGQ